MTRWSVASILVGASLLLTTVSGQQEQTDTRKNRKRESFVEGELIVQFNQTMNPQQRGAVLSSHGLSRLRRFDALDIELVKTPRGLGVAAALKALRNVSGIRFLQPNYVRHTLVGPPPNDPFWLDGSLWGLTKISAQPAWINFTSGDGSVIIGNIDTGVDYTHPDLAANVWRNPLEIPGNGIDDDNNGYVDDVHGIDTANHDSDPMDDQGHGTHTAGTIAAVGNNNLGVTGVNWNARVLPCKFLDATGYGTDAGAIECFNYLIALRNRGENIRVTSNSWGQQRGGGLPAVALVAAIDGAGAAGIINIFGAGNDGSDNDSSPFDPASYPSVSIVSVASSGTNDRRSFFSNFGATSVDLAAPGENILSTYLGGDYQALSGTSMATPHVAGVAALLAKMDPSLSVAAIKALLLDNVDQSSRWTGRVVSGGRLNAFKAATAVGGVSNNVPPTIAITAPAEGATFKAPVAVTVSADAQDTDGSIQQVTFFANGGVIGTDTSAPFSVSWMPSPGNYTLTAVATDDKYGTGTSGAVHIVVLANVAPVVSITSPTSNTDFPAQSQVAISASASDSDGSIQQVAFYVDGVLVSTDGVAPYNAVWDGWIGNHTIKAIATDDQGATGQSAQVSINVLPLAGRINVARSSNGGVATASSTLGPQYPPAGAVNGDRKGLNWGNGGGWNDATQNAGPDWIEVGFAGMKLIEEVNVFSMQDNYTSPIEPTLSTKFTYWGLRNFEMQYWDGSAWLALPGGVVTNNDKVWRRALFSPVTTSKIRVFITAALNGYSRAIEVEAWGIGSGANMPPAVSISAPAAGATFTTPASIAITAAATDTDGQIQKVEFFAGATLIGSDTSAPYNFTWTGAAIGTHQLTAVATDNQGATATSLAVAVVVMAPNVPPAVSIAAPANGASFAAPATVTVTANATDSDGSIVSVEFFSNGASLGVDNAAPFQASTAALGAGAYSLTAVARDNSGATATSASVSITVTGISNRTNVALASNGGVATASSTLAPQYPASGAINGDRRGLNWGNGGGWNDGTPNAGPDWLEVAFNGAKTIDELNLFSMQDNYTSPAEPTPAMTFTLWGVRGFELEYWTGTAWSPISGAVVSNNNLVWRQVLFAPVTTTRIRVNVTAALNGYARIIELEVWGVDAGGPAPPGGPGGTRVNMALASNGGTASASSQLSALYPASGAINGDRRGLNWGNGGGWNDGTANTSPDWIEIAFNGSKTIDEISVFSMQDNYTAPVEPTPAMTFGLWGLRAFEVQYWTGSSWATIPGAAITNNDLVWRRFTIAPVTTTRIRVHITGALNGYSRVVEVEAWGVAAGGGL